MIIARAPLRLSLGGGGTDLPFYYECKGANLILGSINKYLYVLISPNLDDKFVLNYGETESVYKVSEIKHDIIREVLTYTQCEICLNITSFSDVPFGTGLGSSHSFCVALLKAIYELQNKNRTKEEIAEDASYITIEVLETGCGKQDQYAASFGGIFDLSIATDGKCIVKPLDIPNLKILESNLQIYYSGVSRNSSEILKSQSSSDEDKFKVFDEIKSIGIKIRDAIELGDFEKLPDFINYQWYLKRKTSSKMSNDHIDNQIKYMLDNGAQAARVMGAGGGGMILVYISKNHSSFIKKMALAGLKNVKYKFEYKGVNILAL